MRHILDIPLDLITQKDKTNNFEYSSNDGDTLEDLAWRFLGDGQYYFILASINNILNPFEPMKAGQVLSIPPKTIVTGL
jgi:nucleoid-associated protein YgaU